MADKNRHEFKVVIDGVSLDKSHQAHINAAIQKAVGAALLDFGDTGSAKAASVAGNDTIWASFGRTNGIWFRPFDPQLTAALNKAGIAE